MRDTSCENGLTAETAENAEKKLTRQTNGGLTLKIHDLCGERRLTQYELKVQRYDK
jgi:hypothetical protein